MEMICQFNKLKPPEFSGGTESLEYEEWLRRMENLFEVMDCPKGSKVRLATHQFDLGTVKNLDGCQILSLRHKKGKRTRVFMFESRADECDEVHGKV